jgi:hypothetical protein
MTELPDAIAPADADEAPSWNEELPPFGVLVTALADIENEEGVEAMASVEDIRLSLAIEMDVRDEDGTGRPRVAGSTPTQWTETTVLPVFHTLRLHLTRDIDG